MNWGLELEKLPAEMRHAQARMTNAVVRLRKAEQQSRGWEKELASARTNYEVANREYGEVSGRWNPETNEMTPKGLEECPAKEPA